MCAVLLPCNPLFHVSKAINIRLVYARGKSIESYYCRNSKGEDVQQDLFFPPRFDSRALSVDKAFL